MPDLIVIRLHPDKPTDGDSFTEYLKDLKIIISDLSFARPHGKDAQGNDNAIGTALYDPSNPACNIVQHYLPQVGVQPPSVAAVATGAIVIDPKFESPTYPEYISSDVRLTITRKGLAIVDRSVNFNAVVTGDKPPSGAFSGSAKAPDPKVVGTYAGYAPSLYLALPNPGVGLDAKNTAFVNVPTDGTPPNYYELFGAIQKVLDQDPTSGNYNMATLTVDQSRHVAREIIGNRTLNPLPVPPKGKLLEVFYTLQNGSADDNGRNAFESALATFYTIFGAQVDVLARYVFAVSAALACQNVSDAAPRAGFAVPVLPGSTTTNAGSVTNADVILSN
jgi:hypothetical protein